MPVDPQAASVSKPLLWTGRVVSALPVLMLLMSALMKYQMPDEAKKSFANLGYSQNLAMALGIVEVACVIVYVIPQTSVLGAILLTGYLGGATASHVRVGDPFYIPIVVGVLVWMGLYLRDARLRALVPWKRKLG